MFSNLNKGLREFDIESNDLHGDVSLFMTDSMPSMYRLGIFSNRFYGRIPDGFLNSSAITRFSITDNNISGIPDFSAIDHPVVWFFAAQNQIPFEDLEKCLNIEPIRPDRVYLGPQKKLLYVDTLNPDIGDNLKMESGSGGQYSHYQWYFNDEEIPGANESIFTIGSVEGDDYGKYHCVISNDSFEFDLVRNDIHLLQTVNTNSYLDDSMIEVFPNPTSGIIHVQNPYGTIETIQIFNLEGRVLGQYNIHANETDLTLEGYPSGIIILNIKTSFGWISKKVILE